jgi:hypothetical protein
VHCLSVWEWYYAQIPRLHFVYCSPAANPAILLIHFFYRMFDDGLNPFDLDQRSIWAQAHRVKVLYELHCLGSTVRPSMNNQPNAQA